MSHAYAHSHTHSDMFYLPLMSHISRMHISHDMLVCMHRSHQEEVSTYVYMNIHVGHRDPSPSSSARGSSRSRSRSPRMGNVKLLMQMQTPPPRPPARKGFPRKIFGCREAHRSTPSTWRSLVVESFPKSQSMRSSVSSPRHSAIARGTGIALLSHGETTQPARMATSSIAFARCQSTSTDMAIAWCASENTACLTCPWTFFA